MINIFEMRDLLHREKHRNGHNGHGTHDGEAVPVGAAAVSAGGTSNGYGNGTGGNGTGSNGSGGKH